MKRTANYYEWPEALHPLREWLAKQGVDVDALKSARQVLYLAKTLGRQKGKMPPRTADLFPELQKIQRTLCTNGRRTAKPARTAREQWIPGTFGAASEVRRIDRAEYAGHAVSDAGEAA